MSGGERLYYDALKEIAAYDSPEWLRRNSQRLYGLDYGEALEMAYENIRQEAKHAIKGKRAPKAKVDARESTQEKK